MARRNKSPFNIGFGNVDIMNCTTFKAALDKYADMHLTTFRDMAEQMGYTAVHFSGVVTGKRDITVHFAKELQRITGISWLFWMKLWLKIFEGQE